MEISTSVYLLRHSAKQTHSIIPQLNFCYHLLIRYFLVCQLFALSFAYPSFKLSTNERIRRSSDALAEAPSYEQCYYQVATGSIGKFVKLNYGQCMSMNGPDGCCLEGHYKPGMCSNLGHICCTKPDPDCSGMRINKGITKKTIKQQRQLFMKLNTQSEDGDVNNRGQSRYRPARSSSNQRQPLARFRTNFEIVEMPAHMQLDAVSFVTDALDRHHGDFDEAADYLCQMLDQKYSEPFPWSCTIGTDFGYSVEPLPGKYMLFYIGNVNRIRVMAFVSKSVDE